MEDRDVGIRSKDKLINSAGVGLFGRTEVCGIAGGKLPWSTIPGRVPPAGTFNPRISVSQYYSSLRLPLFYPLFGLFN